MPRRWRVPAVLALYLVLLVGLALPHLGIADRGFGRSLIPAGLYLSQVQIAAVGPGFDAGLLGLGINVGYLGIGLHQFGLVLAVVSIWVLATEDINRWIHRLAVVAGWLLTVSAPVVLTGWLLLRASGAPGVLGAGWLAALVSGVGIVVLCRRSRERIDRSWYVAKPELQ